MSCRTTALRFSCRRTALKDTSSYGRQYQFNLGGSMQLACFPSAWLFSHMLLRRNRCMNLPVGRPRLLLPGSLHKQVYTVSSRSKTTSMAAIMMAQRNRAAGATSQLRKMFIKVIKDENAAFNPRIDGPRFMRAALEFKDDPVDLLYMLTNAQVGTWHICLQCTFS